MLHLSGMHTRKVTLQKESLTAFAAAATQSVGWGLQLLTVAVGVSVQASATHRASHKVDKQPVGLLTHWMTARVRPCGFTL